MSEVSEVSEVSGMRGLVKRCLECMLFGGERTVPFFCVGKGAPQGDVDTTYKGDEREQRKER